MDGHNYTWYILQAFIEFFKYLCLGSGKQSAYFISSYPSPSAEESHRSQVSLTLARLTEQKEIAIS